MKVLVFEYITGGGLRGERLPESLLREGGLMLEAVVGDLLDIEGISVTVLRDDRLPPLPPPAGLSVCPVVSAAHLPALWREALEASDAVFPVAPEGGGVLEGLCQDVEQAGKCLLNTPSAGVRLAASKFQTAQRLASHGVPVVQTRRWSGETPTRPCVVKPDDGAGCGGVQILGDDNTGLDLAVGTDWVVQPLEEGEALSLSGLFSSGRGRLLSCNRQMIERGRSGFVLRGCQVNALRDDEGRWQGLLDDIARAVPELWGYAGVDLVLGGAGPKVLEINPRLTTSYAGLRRALGCNPASLVLDLLGSGRLPRVSPGRDVVEISLESGLGR